MENHLIELDYVEKELAILRSHLQQSFQILSGLATVPEKFEELERIYHQLKENISQAKPNYEEIAKLEAAFSQSIAKIETAIESKSQEFKSELIQLRDELSSADVHLSNYNAELAKQVSEIREEAAKRLTNFWRDLANDEAARTSLNQIFEARLNSELEDFAEQLGDAGFNSQLIEKQEMLETELRLTQSSLHDTARQLQMIRNFTTVTGLTVAITLGLVILQLLNRVG